METYESDSLKSEESGAISFYNNLKSVTRLFRIVEICIVLVFLSWTSTRLPFAVKITGDYFRQLITVIISPIFIFLVCNAIVLTLFLNAGGFFAGQSPSAYAVDSSSDDPYYDTDFTNTGSTSLVSDLDDVVEYQDKETIYEENNDTLKTGDFDSPVKLLEADVSEVPEFKTKNSVEAELKQLTRSKSEKLKMETTEEDTHGELRRSETERWRKVANPGEIPEETVYVVDELSNEEFQQTIETFIAKQIKFRQEEKLAIVVSSHA